MNAQLTISLESETPTVVGFLLGYSKARAWKACSALLVSYLQGEGVGSRTLEPGKHQDIQARVLDCLVKSSEVGKAPRLIANQPFSTATDMSAIAEPSGASSVLDVDRLTNDLRSYAAAQGLNLDALVDAASVRFGHGIPAPRRDPLSTDEIRLLLEDDDRALE